MSTILTTNYSRQSSLDLTDAMIISNPVSTPLTSLLLSRGKAYRPNDFIVRSKMKNLSTVTSGGREEGQDAPNTEASTFTYNENALEIFSKATQVSRTVGQLQGGNAKTALSREIADRLQEMKGDIELAFFSGYKSVGSYRRMDGLLNQTFNTVDAGSVDGSGFTVPGELTQDLILDGAQKMYEKGATNGEIFVFANATYKRKINKLFSDSQRASIQLVPGVNGAGIVIDKIYSDFGVLNLVIADKMPPQQVLIVNLDYVKVPQLQAPMFEELAKTGDSEKGQIVAELAVQLENPYGATKIINIA